MKTAFLTIDWETPQSFLRNLRKNNVSFEILRHELMLSTHLLLDLFSEKNITATFFISFSEYKLYGKNFIEKLVKLISDSGHEIGLHTHPEMIYPEVIFLKDLDYDLKVDFVKQGVEFLSNITGKKVVSHRAGAYGISNECLGILEQNGILVDSSFYHGHVNCNLDFDESFKNKIFKNGNLIEVPVTTIHYKPKIHHRILNKVVHAKTDINSINMNYWDKIIESQSENSFINLFLHSYSLTNYSQSGISYKKESINNFNKILDVMFKNKFKFKKLNDVLNKNNNLFNSCFTDINNF